MTGVMAALSAYVVWGIVPLFFRAVADVPALEILSHRILWACVMLAVVLALRGALPEALALLKRRKTGWAMAASALFISVNWTTFIHAVNTGRTLHGVIGYYLFPLVTVVLGRLFLGEAISRRQGFAVLLALVGVGIAARDVGGLPWISLVLAVSFSCYGLVRKMVPVPALSGLFVETLLLTPLVLAYLAGREILGEGMAFLDGPLGRSLWLVALGPLTAIPLILFAFAAGRLRLSLVGILQYISPTIQFLVAVLILGEPLTSETLATFLFIWGGVGLYLWPARRKRASDSD